MLYIQPVGFNSAFAGPGHRGAPGQGLMIKTVAEKSLPWKKKMAAQLILNFLKAKNTHEK
jgi:hypothetical protein